MSAPDRTYLAVRRQLGGMRASGYEVGILDRATGRMTPRRWSAADVLKSVAWLKRQNQQGSDIYIRPAPVRLATSDHNQGLILLDDLTSGALDQLEGRGLPPAAIIETSPLNFQAWIRVSQEPIPTAVATALAKDLAQRFAADPNSADWRHYGRLAGFTNRKAMYGGTRGQPYVLAGRCNGKLAQNVSELLQKAFEVVQQAELAKSAQQPSQAAEKAQKAYSPQEPDQDPVQYYQRTLKGLIAHYGTDLDASRADWMIGKAMAIAGYSPATIEQTLYQTSPSLDTRKKGHVDDYVTRTVRNLLRDPEVKDARLKDGPGT